MIHFDDTLSRIAAVAVEPVTEHVSTPRLKSYLYRGLAGLFLALAAAGVFLPSLPTTPFVIVAAWAAGKSSPAMRERLRRHPRYGPALVAWQDYGAISRRAKTSAIALMFLSWMILWWTAPIIWIPIGAGALLCLVATYLLSRPSLPAADGHATATVAKRQLRHNRADKHPPEACHESCLDDDRDTGR